MSAPNTNPDKQAEQHRGPLTGMAMMVLFAGVLLLGLILFVTMRGGAPEGAATQVDGRTGATEEAAGGDDGVSANDYAEDDEGAAAPDATAVTVAPETVTAPDSGAGNPADTDPGESQAAEPRE